MHALWSVLVGFAKSAGAAPGLSFAALVGFVLFAVGSLRSRHAPQAR